MARSPGAPLDDSYSAIKITDFSGGMVTQASPLVLGSNQCAALMNCIHLPGRLIFRGGYDNIAGLPAGADGAWKFYDSNGAKHYAVWSNGNLYDCVSGTATLVESSVYTAGQKIGSLDYNNVLYWSSGQPVPVPLRFWNPAAATHGAVAQTGASPPPSSDFIFLYTNAIVALAPTWSGPTYQPNVFGWSAINDPGNWNTANSQASGPLNGGRLEFGMPFGIAEVGVSPFQNIVIGRNDLGIYAYSGALGSLHEALLNCPVGVKDRATAQYLPTAGQFGTIVFLGTDGQVWSTNGIAANVISGDILPTLQSAYSLAIANNVSQRFYSGYNQAWQYYYVDIAGTQFVYRWPTNSWTMFSGWPSGISFNSTDATGAPGMFIASNAVNNNNLSQVGVMGLADNGTMPPVYYVSPVLHGGDFNKFKDFQWGAIATFDTGAIYNMTAQSIRYGNSTQMVANTVQLTSPQTGASLFIIGQSLLGGPNVLGLPATSISPGTPVVMQGRFAVPIPASEFMPAGRLETLKGNGCQIKIAYGGGSNVFDLLGVEVLYVPKGYRRGSGAQYNPEDLSNQPFDPFTYQ